MVIYIVKLVYSAVKVQLPVSGMNRWGMNISGPGVIWHKACRSLDLHADCFLVTFVKLLLSKQKI